MTSPQPTAERALPKPWAEVLAYVRQNPGSKTSAIAAAQALTQARARHILRQLLELRLVGRQQSMIMGEFESTWLPERTDAADQ